MARFKQVSESRRAASLRTIAVLDLTPEELARRFGFEFIEASSNLGPSVGALIEDEDGRQYLLVRELESPVSGVEVRADESSRDPERDVRRLLGGLGLKRSEVRWTLAADVTHTARSLDEEIAGDIGAALRRLRRGLVHERMDELAAAGIVIRWFEAGARRLAPSLDADDIASRAFERLLSRLKFVRPDSETSFAWSILRMTALDHHRAHSRRSPEILITEDVADFEDDIAAVLDADAARSALWSALRASSEVGDAAAIRVATTFMELVSETGEAPSTRAIGVRVGLSHVAVAKALRRLRDRLQAPISSEADSHGEPSGESPVESEQVTQTETPAPRQPRVERQPELGRTRAISDQDPDVDRELVAALLAREMLKGPGQDG